jgi:hypothetical protein
MGEQPVRKDIGKIFEPHKGHGRHEILPQKREPDQKHNRQHNQKKNQQDPRQGQKPAVPFVGYFQLGFFLHDFQRRRNRVLP